MAQIQDQRVEVTVTSPTQGFTSLQKLDRSLTIADLKCKLELVVGIPPVNMKLSVYDVKNSYAFDLSDDSKMLGAYAVEENYRIHVASTSPVGNGGIAGITDFLDTSKVEKFEMSEEAYDQMKGSVRDFKRKMKMGRFNEEEMKQQAETKERQQKEYKLMQEKCLESVKIGDRCETRVPKQPSRRGEVMFIGEASFKPDIIWVGIKLDEPYGKNDGEVQGKRYFTCPPNYGSMVKIEFVQTGDFPPLDDDLDGLDEI